VAGLAAGERFDCGWGFVADGRFGKQSGWNRSLERFASVERVWEWNRVVRFKKLAPRPLYMDDDTVAATFRLRDFVGNVADFVNHGQDFVKHHGLIAVIQFNERRKFDQFSDAGHGMKLHGIIRPAQFANVRINRWLAHWFYFGFENPYRNSKRSNGLVFCFDAVQCRDVMQVTCNCNNCSAHLEFDSKNAGQVINCPTCGVETTLYVPPPPPIPNFEKFTERPSAPIGNPLTNLSSSTRETPILASVFYIIGVLTLIGAILCLIFNIVSVALAVAVAAVVYFGIGKAIDYLDRIAYATETMCINLELSALRQAKIIELLMPPEKPSAQTTDIPPPPSLNPSVGVPTKNYFIYRNGTVHGPIEATAIWEMHNDGLLTDNTP
jgi:hypothetical protein